MLHERSASKENMASLRRDTKHGLAEAEHQTRPRRGETRQGMMAQKKIRETLIQNIMRLSKRFPRIHELMKSSQPEDNRCCVCRDFTAARCDKQATNYAWLGRVYKTARVTLK